MSKFSTVAKDTIADGAHVSVSHIMDGRSKIALNDLTAQYPDGVTITGFALIPDKKNEGKTYPALICKEDSEHFFFGGSELNKICTRWLDEFGSDAQTLSKELAAEGGVKVRFGSYKTKRGNTLTTVTIVE